MTRKATIGLAMSLAMIGVAALAGCSQSEASTGPVALAVIVSPHANAPAPQASDGLRAALDAAVSSHGYVTVIINDGRPAVVEGGGSTVGSDAKTEGMVRKANGQQIASLLTFVMSQQVDDPENAPLQALGLAARELTSSPGNKRVFIQDSGLQTVDPVSFVPAGALSSDPDEVATYLAGVNELPDLSGLQVTWNGLGDTAPPQSPLGEAARRNLQKIWRAIIERAGGTVTFDEHALSLVPADGLPSVTPVPVPEPAKLPVTCTPQAITFTNSDIRFRGDEAVYVDPAQARDILQPVAQRIVVDGLTVHVIGTTASSRNAEFIADLSRDRAATVRGSLIELGAPPDAITAEGQGMADQWHIEDRDAAGNLIPHLAEQNRKVVLLLSGTTGC